jgi:hypothetical protein
MFNACACTAVKALALQQQRGERLAKVKLRATQRSSNVPGEDVDDGLLVLCVEQGVGAGGATLRFIVLLVLSSHLRKAQHHY